LEKHQLDNLARTQRQGADGWRDLQMQVGSWAFPGLAKTKEAQKGRRTAAEDQPAWISLLFQLVLFVIPPFLSGKLL
jgi:hypothetical protein